MIKKEVLAKTLARAIKNGVEMNLGVLERNKFLLDLTYFINKDALFCANYNNNRVTIESIFYDPILSVDFENSNLHCIPVTDDGDWIDAVFVVFKFIHLSDEKTQEAKKKKIKKINIDTGEFDWI